jgi:hypothetical protein
MNRNISHDLEMAETGTRHTNRPQEALPHFSGVGDEHLAADVRAIACPTGDMHVLAWTRDFNNMAKTYMCLFISLLVLTVVWVLVFPPELNDLAFLLGFDLLVLCFLLFLKGTITHTYWIVCPSDLTVVVKANGRICLLSCRKWNYSVRKIPLSSIVECRALPACCNTALCVNASTQALNPTKKFQIIGHRLSEPQWFADKVLEQMNVVQAPSRSQSTTSPHTGSVVATNPPDSTTNQR